MYERANSPQSIGAVLDDGFRLYRAALGKVLVLTFLASIAGQVPSVIISATGAGSAGFVAFLALLVVVLISLQLYAAVIARMDAVAEQREMSAGQALSRGASRIPALFLFSVLYMLAVAAGTLLLLIPGIILGVSLMFGFYLVVLEGQGPVEGLKSSHTLVWGNWWRTMVIVSVATIIMMTAYILVGVLAGFAYALTGGTNPDALLPFIELVLVPILGAVVAPLFYALTLATYYDLRLRRSGADLEQRLGAPSEA